jgi:pimeloyl-ACP methyl ester carboxylesterase
MSNRLPTRNGDVELVTTEWPGSTPDTPLLIALHGMGLRGEIWAGLADRLAGRYRVVAPDLRGYGDSGKPDAGYRLADLTEDLRIWLDHLGAGRATLVAHSYSARAGLNFAALSPERVERLVAIEPVLPEGGRAPPGFVERLRQRSDAWPSREEMLSSLRARPLYAPWRADRLEWYVDRCAEPDPGGGVRLIWGPARMATHVEEIDTEPRSVDHWSYFGEVARPVLVVHGRDSVTGFTREAAEKLAASLPHAEPVEVPGTHNLQLEHPEEVERFIAEWFDESPPAGA